ncbi:cell wall-active antibiotics response protein LiaF [Alkalihalobacterium chitinilyticum]|uniref:Cell wall-active antibiotics response protein LiaF n=1 Tax=Alkalihalobacterium chitinilyticum TaxID=2980103 RepID=A0ABT5VL55_9BACI|nr:cell wall-active antibiotics response protein LiaF [Alkalihalobacterium chitinilyticum]MDE5414989.1 cell wall-active antibiotics response protein LiaF [Alkalihalobacterium chitinilyticum]
MHTSRNVIIGIIIILIGLSALLNTIGFNFHLGLLIGPLIFFVIGLFFYRKGHRWLSIIFLLISFVTFFDNVVGVNITGIIIAVVFIYFGYKLLTGHEKAKDNGVNDNTIDREIDELVKSVDELVEDVPFTKEKPKQEEPVKKVHTTPSFRSALIGDFRLLSDRYELQDMNIRNGIGDIKIDLSKAIIPEGETVIVIHGWIGDIDVYVPYDLDLSVQAMVTVGDLDILDSRQSGINRNIAIATKDYKQAPRRVKLVLSLLIGDIDVRYV